MCAWLPATAHIWGQKAPPPPHTPPTLCSIHWALRVCHLHNTALRSPLEKPLGGTHVNYYWTGGQLTSYGNTRWVKCVLETWKDHYLGSWRDRLGGGESFGGFHEGKLQLRSNSATGGQQQSNAPAELHLHSGAVGGVHSGFSPLRGVNEFKTSSLTRRQLSQIHRRGNLI